MKPKYFFFIIFFATLYGILYLYKPFLMNLTIAALLCIASFGLKKYIDRFVRYNFLSSFFAVFIFLAIFVIPLFVVGSEILHEIKSIDLNALTNFIKDTQEKAIALLQNLPDALKERTIEAIKSINISEGVSYAVNLSATFGKASVKFFIDLGFILIFLYLFYYYGVVIRDYIIDIVPFSKKTSVEILSETGGVLKVVFFTSIISMILQGLSFGVVAGILGFSGVLFGVAYGLASIVPLVGGAIVWLPFALYLYYLGEVKSAIFVALYSMIFIGFVIDNVIKPLIIGVVNNFALKEPVKINEMIIFIAILAGMASFGFWGVIIGPTLSAFFIALLRVYKNQKF
ncbi:AI-2E family transporter [Helicobacter sp. 23-1045]